LAAFVAESGTIGASLAGDDASGAPSIADRGRLVAFVPESGTIGASLARK
jgi:hypothetical protein